MQSLEWAQRAQMSQLCRAGFQTFRISSTAAFSGTFTAASQAAPGGKLKEGGKLEEDDKSKTAGNGGDPGDATAGEETDGNRRSTICAHEERAPVWRIVIRSGTVIRSGAIGDALANTPDGKSDSGSRETFRGNLWRRPRTSSPDRTLALPTGAVRPMRISAAARRSAGQAPGASRSASENSVPVTSTFAEIMAGAQTCELPGKAVAATRAQPQKTISGDFISAVTPSK